MTDLPDRIHVEEPESEWVMGLWWASPRADLTEYVRATIPALAKALREALTKDENAGIVLTALLLNVTPGARVRSFFDALRALEDRND